MKILKVMLSTLLSTIGGAFLVLGELDDAPGLGGIGLIFIAISIYLNLKNK